ncbi:MAG: zinc-binding dehydrogenase [Actinomycetota bacterium]
MSPTMRAWRVHEYGEPADVLRLEDVPVPEPGGGEVRVRAEGIALNLNDLERVTGANMAFRPELPYAPGMETMGVVDAVGPGAEAWLGQRVVASTKMAYGGFAEHVLAGAAATFPMPDDIPFPDAAAVMFPYHLAWLGLVDRARLRAGETVLVHAAAGGSGSAAVQLAVDEGARVIATVGSDGKAQLCRDLGAEVVVDYTRDDFAATALELTGQRGVDVVFDNVGAAVMPASMRCLAYNGRYLMMGFASDKRVLDEPYLVPRQLSVGNFMLCGVLLAYADPDTVPVMKAAIGANFVPSDLGARLHADIVERLRAGRVRAVVGDVVPFEELPRALTALAGRATVGRTVVAV